MERGVYIRVGAHTRRADGEILEELRLLRSRCGYDEQLVPTCPVAELDIRILPKPLQSEKSLLSIEVLRRDPFSGNINPTRAGILMFHPQPERFIPEAMVIISRMRGDTGRDTIETHDVTGPLPVQLEASIGILEDWLGRNPKITNAKYKNTASLIPADVIREALCNALFHRQYSIAGAVKVAMYADRMEIFSPGHFAGPFVAESLGDGTSYIRNKALALVARRFGLMEKRGTGIKLIMDRMKSIGSIPRFIEGTNWFKVTLPFPQPGAERNVPPEEIILAMFETSPEVTTAMVCKRLSISKATAVGIIKRLIQGGKIKRIGNGPKTRYAVTGF
jgi:ATP-dependent DNA helicase RecG